MEFTLNGVWYGTCMSGCPYNSVEFQLGSNTGDQTYGERLNFMTQSGYRFCCQGEPVAQTKFYSGGNLMVISGHSRYKGIRVNGWYRYV